MERNHGGVDPAGKSPRNVAPEQRLKTVERRRSHEGGMEMSRGGVPGRFFPGGAAPGLQSERKTALGPPPEGPRVTFTQTMALI